MPRGSKPGERRGGRQVGAVNGRTVAKAAETQVYIKATVERVLREYGNIAFLDIREAYDANGDLLPIHEMPESVTRALAGIEVASLNVDGDGKGPVGTLRKIKILDKIKALDSIAKHLGMFIDRIGNPDGSALQITDIKVHFVKAIDGRPALRLGTNTDTDFNFGA